MQTLDVYCAISATNAAGRRQSMYPRGSEWRRWDLHVHTPGTVLNDQFGDWEEYLRAIEAGRDVKVIGATDYMTINNYSKLKTYKQQGRIPNVEFLVPNIEFRIAPPSDRATAVNIHLIVSPDDPNHEGAIVNALGRLNWRYGQPPRNYSCVPDQLISLGRAFDPTIADDRAALAAGVLQFVSVQDVFEWLYEVDHIRLSYGVSNIMVPNSKNSPRELRELFF